MLEVPADPDMVAADAAEPTNAAPAEPAALVICRAARLSVAGAALAAALPPAAVLAELELEESLPPAPAVPLGCTGGDPVSPEAPFE